MNTRGTLLLHGYGVRGGTWKSVQASLGATVGPTSIAGAILIAPPYGEREQLPSPLLKFLLRPRFFSAHTPLQIQKEIFANAVPEAPALRETTLGRLLGSEIVVLGEDDDVGHDDFFASPTIAAKTAEIVRDFATRV